MARANHDKKIPIIQAQWRTGHYSQRDLAKMHNVSPGFVAKWTKGIEQDAAKAVSAGVIYKQILADDNEHLVSAVSKVVDEKTKHIQFFNNATLKNLSVMMKKVNDDTDIVEHKIAQDALAKGRETVLGKQPETAIQINHNANSLKGFRVVEE